jgi:CHAD domain-containing protein
MAKATQVDGLNFDGPASDAIGQVLLVRMEEMCALGEKAVDWNDPENVHNMRVASRRLRGAAHDFSPYLNSRPLVSSFKSIKKVARALGRVRDFDVTIERLTRTANKAPEDLKTCILEIVADWNEDLEKSRVKLLPWIESESLEELRAKFAIALTNAIKPRKHQKALGGNGAEQFTYRHVAKAVILERLTQFEELSDSLYRPLKMKPLHNLRIAAKHLRYALELFEGGWSSSLASIAQHVAAIQSALGDVHDCDIMIEDFGKAAVQQVGDPNRQTISSWLMMSFLEQRDKALKKSLKQWKRWQSEAMAAAIRKIVEDDSAGNAEGPV